MFLLKNGAHRKGRIQYINIQVKDGKLWQFLQKLSVIKTPSLSAAYFQGFLSFFYTSNFTVSSSLLLSLLCELLSEL
ncbi:hypothetical protein TH63_11835 [Rufibacter radiotolerans]|uniref:Uncharacterized protein n=1 Tax=Rufibacter radiotolerans TaxID=1379910 RepID=A0A0H4W6W3_9BACT|nr:hypothetical protein TH63_11835 [Rufibacter radiotolerans]